VSEKGPQATFSHLPGLREGDALIVVDVQRDFLPGGSLAIPAGDEVVAPLSAYIAAFDARNLPIFLTRDWHPENHCSFRNAGGRWPSHCVRGTPGADWPAELKFPVHTRIVSKGSDAVTEAYSGFSGTSLLTILRELGVRRLFVGGLATDYCVHDTVMDACLHGFEVVVLADAIRGVNAEPGDETRSIREMLARGATLFQPSVRRGASPRTGSQAGRTAIPPRGPP
jgi:nicotinamidase/pyrazinamidase